MKNKSSQRGLTLIEVLILIAIVVVIAGMLLPVPSKPKTRAYRAACVNNLKQIGIAQKSWWIDHQSSTNEFQTIESAAPQNP